ncbi:hypothetical protein PUR71_28950 [Streptomyces sp. SP17BM10]|uniref:hypothetical protein n=1 Tax=Streptomyces sp. SP17BM10 TaxID=3002530 RepID=UPI002E76C179|nr:hypothetical protein [Streptomyces sp. SP17BM10]MEE1786903.1 hypothetical protein [Streptomyces sp. SP17BM10]
MQSVQFAEDSLGVTAHTRRPSPAGRFADITTLLMQRDVDFTIDFETGDYIDAQLPDGSSLVAGPLYDEDQCGLEQMGPQNGWFVGWLERGGDLTTLYNSQPGMLNQQHGTNVGPMLACIDDHLDQRGVPSQQDVRDRLVRAESLLHRAGFIPVVRYGRETYHRLPAAMVDSAERRTAVTRAVDYLRAESFGVNCPAGLIDPEAAPVALPSRPLAELGANIAKASHTGEVVEALSELTAPGDGVLDQVVGVLNQTAAWWKELGGGADPHYAARLRYIADKADGYVREIRAMRGDLADRHAAHPHHSRPVLPTVRPTTGTDARVEAALATSPTVLRTPTAHAAEAVPSAAVTPVRSAGPRR